MSESEPHSSQQIRRTVQIPSVLTNSLQAILAAFGDDIYQLRASGSIETTNESTIDDLRDYGVSWEQQDTQRITIDYQQLPGAEGPVNPLTEDACNRLLEEVATRLGRADGHVEPDLAVTSCTVRTTCEPLQAVTPAQTAEFDFRFVSDPVEDPIREVTQRYNADRGLYSQLGFDVRNLNLRSVIETATLHHQQVDGKYLSWAGPDDIRPHAPEPLAIRINDHVLPDEYGVLKPYVVTEDSVLELSDEAADAIPEAQPFGDEMGGEA